jgi:hypothetical protein
MRVQKKNTKTNYGSAIKEANEVREFEVATRLLYVVAKAQPYKLSPALYYNSTRIDVDTAQ